MSKDNKVQLMSVMDQKVLEFKFQLVISSIANLGKDIMAKTFPELNETAQIALYLVCLKEVVEATEQFLKDNTNV